MKAAALSVVLLLTLNFNLSAQGLPPIPGGGETKPRDPTPEELEEQRKAREARLQKNLERFEPYLIKTVEQLAGDNPVDGRFLSLEDLLWRRYEGAPSVEDQLQAARVQETKRIADARHFGVPLLSRTDNGDAIVFDGMDNMGRPRFVASQSLNVAKTIQTDKVWPGGSLGLSLTGTNRTIAFWDVQHPYTAHPVFGSNPYERLFIMDWYAYPDDPVTDHATMVAGILGGAQGTGSPGSEFKGMAFGAQIHAYEYKSDFNELRIAYTNSSQTRITSHSYGTILGWAKVVVSNLVSWGWVGVPSVSQSEDLSFGSYNLISSNMDHVAYSQPYQLSVWAAGNEGVTGRGMAPPIQPTNHYVWASGYQQGTPQLITNVTRPADGDAGGYDTLLPEATAKNTIVVGSVSNLLSGYQGTNSVFLDPQSSYGPTDAGLIKPDLVASGVDVLGPVAPSASYKTDSGTSFATPSVAGSLMLLLDHFLATHTNWTAVLASTLKALAIHTADEIGADGPDFKHGWGLMNTAASAQLISSNALNSSHIFEILLQTNKPYIGHFRVTDTNGLFKVTAVWTDPAAPPSPDILDPTAPVLVNDIDLRLIAPNGQVFEPWVLNPDLTGKSATARAQPATRGDDSRNNVEQVGVRLPQAGIWKAVLTHKGTNLWGAAYTNVTHQPVSLVASGNVEIVADPVEILDMAPVPGNQLAFLFSTQPGLWYELQWINPVTASNWSSIYAVNAQSEITAITIARPSTNRFYRVLRTQ